MRGFGGRFDEAFPAYAFFFFFLFSSFWVEISWRSLILRTDVNACDCTRGCTDTVRESALKVDSGRKIPCRTGESHLRRRRAGPMLYQPSYIPTPNKFVIWSMLFHHLERRYGLHGWQLASTIKHLAIHLLLSYAAWRGKPAYAERARGKGGRKERHQRRHQGREPNRSGRRHHQQNRHGHRALWRPRDWEDQRGHNAGR